MRFLNSLFWQLYLGILGALVLIVVLFFAMMEYSSYQTDTEDFYRDIHMVSQPILVNWKRTHQVNSDLMRKISDESIFHISVLENDALLNRLTEYERVRTINRVGIYQHVEEGLSLAAQVLPDSDLWLIIEDIDVDPDADDISDSIRQNFEDELHDESQQETILQLSAIGLLILVGTVLLVLVQRIRRHIEGLISVSNDWAKGDLSVKANVDAPAPLDQLAHGLNKMADELNQTLTEQQVMAHAISHELRTPLSKLQLALTLMVRKHADLQGEPLADDLLRYIDELETLVNQMLTFAKLNYQKASNQKESGQSEIESTEMFDASKLISERINELKVLTPDKNINLSCESGVCIKGNLFNLQIAIDNIIKNALKYADQRVQVSIVLESNQHQVCITVEDDGPGIPPEKIKTILMPFARVDESRNRASGGFGLGLAIVDAIVRQHEGEVSLAKSPLGGLSFSITLPLD
ncbi:MAG: ATP-binding protein [Pseudomonadales bacterium]|nr:ATP-binding protein [Pseudomonadales bacterium]